MWLQPVNEPPNIILIPVRTSYKQYTTFTINWNSIKYERVFSEVMLEISE